MIKGKKIAVVLMTATLSIAMLAGCGSKKFDLEKDQNAYLPWLFDMVNRFYQCFKPLVKKYK